MELIEPTYIYWNHCNYFPVCIFKLFDIGQNLRFCALCLYGSAP